MDLGCRHGCSPLFCRSLLGVLVMVVGTRWEGVPSQKGEYAACQVFFVQKSLALPGGVTVLCVRGL
ncbi:hypothetical protein HMPREF1868_01679 [Olsenella sp. DNF00959]|nr:hypothetical protein HMPREF1868_01679 [Olsenella sp. DNF00959]